MTAIAAIIYMSIMSRMAGGGLGAKYLDRVRLTWLPELLFAVPFGAALSILSDNFIVASIMLSFGAAWSYIWMQTGHGAILHWGMEPVRDPDRKQFLTPFVDWLSGRLGIVKNSTPYCRLFMAVKGFLIGLPVGGVVLAVLWPLAYEIGARLRGKVKFDPHIVSEVLAGAGAGLAIAVFVW